MRLSAPGLRAMRFETLRLLPDLLVAVPLAAGLFVLSGSHGARGNSARDRARWRGFGQ